MRESVLSTSEIEQVRGGGWSLDLLREKVARPIRGARLVVVPGAGHYVQVERARETAAVLGAFLAGLGG